MSEGPVVVSHGIAAAIGAAVIAVARWAGGKIEKTQAALIAEKDRRIAVLEADNARLSATIDKLGHEKDGLRTQLETERVKAAAVTYRIRHDSNVSDDFAEEMPTAVRRMADLMDPKSTPKPDPHPELEGWDPALSTPPGTRPKKLPRPR